MSLVTLQDERWREHLAGCDLCTHWFTSGGWVGYRCLDGWAISEVFEQLLEQEMPSRSKPLAQENEESA